MANIYTVDGGHHNANIVATAARLTELGAWKQQRVVQIIPTSERLPAQVYTAHMGLAKPPNQAFIPLVITGAEVGAAYEAGIDVVLNHPELSQFEYILFIEHDNIPPTFGLVKLLQHMDSRPDLSAISGLYFLKGMGGHAQIWGDIKDPVPNYRPQVPDPKGGIVETYGIGQGFALWRMDVFKKLKEKGIARPWFKTLCGPTEGVGTQDLYFANLARTHAGAKMAVACDVPVGHIDVDGKFGPPGKIW